MGTNRLLISCLILLINTIVAFPSDYYVDSSANPFDLRCDGTKDNPWRTITQALSIVEGTEAEPAVIRVAAGRYDLASGETFPLTMKSNISLIGAERETTIINATGAEKASIIFSLDVSNVVIEGLTLTGGKGSLASTG